MGGGGEAVLLLTSLKSSVVLQINALLQAVKKKKGKKLAYDYCCVDVHKGNAK